MRYSRRRPSRRVATSPASRSTLRCCDSAGWLIANGSHSSVTLSSPRASRSSTARRVGSEIARNASVLPAAARTLGHRLDEVERVAVEILARHLRAPRLTARLAAELDPTRQELLVRAQHVVDLQHPRRALADLGGATVDGALQDDRHVAAARHHGEPAKVPHRHVVPFVEAEALGVEAQRFVLVVHENGDVAETLDRHDSLLVKHISDYLYVVKHGIRDAAAGRAELLEIEALVLALLVDHGPPHLVGSLVLGEPVGDGGADAEVEVLDLLHRVDELLGVDVAADAPEALGEHLGGEEALERHEVGVLAG